jgi:hypothetical protein
MFVVVGAQRTGTNILREILNTHHDIAMLGEILSPSAAPAHWDNFLSGRPERNLARASAADVEELLDEYFAFVRYRIREHWARGLKSDARTIGVDIKYNQLRRIAPGGWSTSDQPFLVRYLVSRGFTFVHAVRNNGIHRAISESIATQRQFWHNYRGVVIDSTYRIDIAACLERARTIEKERAGFISFSRGSRIVTSYYSELERDIARTLPDGAIPEAPGALREVARALEVPYNFYYDGRLQRAINMPYSRVISNYEELARAVEASEFSAFASTLQ